MPPNHLSVNGVCLSGTEMKRATSSAVPGSLPPGGFRVVSAGVRAQELGSTALGTSCFPWRVAVTSLSQCRWQMIHLRHRYDAHLRSLRLDGVCWVFFNAQMIHVLVLVLQKLQSQGHGLLWSVF